MLIFFDRYNIQLLSKLPSNFKFFVKIHDNRLLNKLQKLHFGKSKMDCL